MNRALICITTCNRLSELKKYVIPYIAFSNSSQSFDFVLSVDGDNKEYIDFCRELEIPMVYSDQREGVGISKNRILTQFPKYDHYFFIDDDVELLDAQIFNAHIDIGNKSTEFYHMSSTNLFNIKETAYIHGTNMIYGMIGGGYFNYFNRKGLEKVGGWHSNFAKYKRYGHTEHSYRFLNIGFSKYPFTIILDQVNNVIVHNPEHVTSPIHNQESQETELFTEEQRLIDERLTYFPITTISNFHFNEFNMEFNEKVAAFIAQNPKKYPLTKGFERMKCLSSHSIFLSKVTSNVVLKTWYFCIGLMYYPLNPEIKHLIKTKFSRK